MNLLDKFHHWRRRRRWNKQYRSGRWESLKSELEAKRYFQLIDQMKEFASPNPSILDIGCGDGVLNERMGDYLFRNFVGVDFSSVSIEKAKAKNYPKSRFIAEDILKYSPAENFDVIIFNEAFYYIPDNEKARVLDLMLDHLNPNGLMIVSIFRDGLGCWEFFKESNRLKELDFTQIDADSGDKYWKIGAYRLVINNG